MQWPTGTELVTSNALNLLPVVFGVGDGRGGGGCGRSLHSTYKHNKYLPCATLMLVMPSGIPIMLSDVWREIDSCRALNGGHIHIDIY